MAYDEQRNQDHLPSIQVEMTLRVVVTTTTPSDGLSVPLKFATSPLCILECLEFYTPACFTLTFGLTFGLAFAFKLKISF